MVSASTCRCPLRWRRTTGPCSSTSRCPAGSWATSTAASATVATSAMSAAGLRAVAWERSAGQVVQIALTVVVLLALPSPVQSSMPLVAIAVVVAAFGAVLVARARPGGGRSRWARVRSAAAGDIRDGLLARRAWLAIALASALVVGGHVATFLIAARTAGTTAPPSRMLPLALLVLLAMVLPERRWLGAARGRDGVGVRRGRPGRGARRRHRRRLRRAWCSSPACRVPPSSWWGGSVVPGSGPIRTAAPVAGPGRRAAGRRRTWLTVRTPC